VLCIDACWLGDSKGTEPVKTSASKPLMMAVNVSVQGTDQSTMSVRRVLINPVKMLRIWQLAKIVYISLIS